MDLEELEDVVEMCLTVFFSMKNIPNFLEKENSPKVSCCYLVLNLNFTPFSVEMSLLFPFVINTRIISTNFRNK